MDERRIPELIEKYIAGTATKPEREELLDWYRSVEHDEVHWPEEEAVFEERVAGLFSQIKQSANLTVDNSSPIKRVFPWRFVSVAAVLLIIIGVATTFFINNARDVSEYVSQEDEIRPGTNKALLTLANGQTYTLGDTMNTFEIVDQGTFIEENGELRFRSEKQLTSPTFNKLTTPKGGQYTIYLPDGTKVSLNCESSLSFPGSFTGKERKVMLEGEAYFEVAGNKDMPFIVSMSAMEIEVLGTTFNVKDYQDEDNIAATLLEGSVKVSSAKNEMLLKPGQSAILNKQNGEIHAKKANVSEETAWKDGYFIFDDENIKNIMNQLSRWYAIEVIYQGDMGDKMYSGRILRRSDIIEVLDMLEQTGTIKFQIEGRRVVVMP